MVDAFQARLSDNPKTHNMVISIESGKVHKIKQKKRMIRLPSDAANTQPYIVHDRNHP